MEQTRAVFFGFKNEPLKKRLEKRGINVHSTFSRRINTVILQNIAAEAGARLEYEGYDLRYILLETVDEQSLDRSNKKTTQTVPTTATRLPHLHTPPPTSDEPSLTNVPRFELRALTLNSAENRKNFLSSYTVAKLESDISDDGFILHAIKCELECLKNKRTMYRKLSRINWSEEVGKKPKLSVVINDMMYVISARISFVENQTIDAKRASMESIIFDPDYGIHGIKGKARDDIKNQLVKFIYVFFRAPTFYSASFTNFMLTGSAGSGKTKVAMCIAHVLRNLGLLATSNVVSATKTTLIASFVGQSANKTRNVMIRSLESVLFIDEAYTLTPCKSTSDSEYEKEAIGELINFMDKFIGCVVVIVAGYKQIMQDCFITFNEGIARRFPRVVDLPPYSANDLWHIFTASMGDRASMLSLSQRSFIASMISSLDSIEIPRVFSSQAGDMLNLANLITEDMLLTEVPDYYDNDAIFETFRSFCANKNLEFF